MSLEDIDGFNGILDIPSQVDRLDGLHRIDSHRRKEVIVANNIPGQSLLPQTDRRKSSLSNDLTRHAGLGHIH